MSRIKMSWKGLNKIYLLLFAFCGVQLYIGSRQYGLANYLRKLAWQEKDPFITFIVPSLLRDTLPTTLKSITTQSEPNWEAIVGVDIEVLTKHENLSNLRTAASLAKGTAFLPAVEDSRIRLALNSEAEHKGHNAAGDVRNHLMQFARGEWIAFVDDDDTLSPCYAEWLKRGIKKAADESGEDNVPDLVLFRMRRGESEILPPLHSKSKIVFAQAGISFAVRKQMLTEQDIKFVPSHLEDFQLMSDVFSKGKKLSIASCVGYFVHGVDWDPKHRLCHVDGESTCEFVDAEVVPRG